MRSLADLHTNCEVHAVVRTRPDAPLHGVIYHEINFCRSWTTEGFPAHIDAIIHLAQARNYHDFPDQAPEIFSVNTASTAMLLDYAFRAGAQHFILASTGGVYRPSTQIIDDQTPIDLPEGPLSYYFRTKLSAESLALSYASEMDIIILRPFFIYGPGQSEEKLISKLLASVRDGRKVHLTGESGLVINPVHVDDVALLLQTLLNTSGSRIINVAGPDAVTIRQIADQIGELLKCEPVFTRIGGDSLKLIASHYEVEALLGRKMIRFKNGLRSFVQ